MSETAVAQQAEARAERAKQAAKAAREFSPTWTVQELVAWIRKWQRAGATRRELVRLFMNAFPE